MVTQKDKPAEQQTDSGLQQVIEAEFPSQYCQLDHYIAGVYDASQEPVIDRKNLAQDKGDGIDRGYSQIGFNRHGHAKGKHEVTQQT
jgi:hypothetical protein